MGRKILLASHHRTTANLSSAPERSSAEDRRVALTQQARQGGGVERGTFHFYNYQNFITYAPPHPRAPILLSLPGLSKATSFETICHLSDRQGRREGSACFHPVKNHTLLWYNTLRPRGPMGGLYYMTEQILVPRLILASSMIWILSSTEKPVSILPIGAYITSPPESVSRLSAYRRLVPPNRCKVIATNRKTPCQIYGKIDHDVGNQPDQWSSEK